MRIWSIHPAQLDRQALIACWRETLLAQAVLAGRTAGYRHHPQLARFRGAQDPVGSIGAYLRELADEADRRGYRFDRNRIDTPDATVAPIPVTDGQLDYEWAHLLAKLERRSPGDWDRWRQAAPMPHPAFAVVAGPIESWERIAVERS